MAFVLYSKTEAARSDDAAGYWNETDGWTTADDATLYPERFPVSMIGATVEWLPIEAP
jgi:hypothetical protein